MTRPGGVQRLTLRRTLRVTLFLPPKGRPIRTGLFFIALSSLLFASGEAFADKRVALVIGNSNYSHAPALDNPVNDATAMSVMLEGAGFQVVETRNNLGNMEMRRVILTSRP